MTWTTPRTWTVGELVTAALLNTHLRDNLLALFNRRLHVLVYCDQQSSGVAPATITFGAFRTRVLNTELADTGSYGSLASNQMTLQPGRYIGIGLSAQNANQAHTVAIYNVTGALYYPGLSATGVGSMGIAVTPELQLTVATTFELRHYLATSDAAPGPNLGLGINQYFAWVIWLRTGEA